MYNQAGRDWCQALDKYDLAQQAYQAHALQSCLSHLGEAIVYMQRAVSQGRLTFPPDILAQAELSIIAWYDLFFELVSVLEAI